jgi:hypothetical protein
MITGTSAPSPGDPNICAACGQLLVFGEQLEMLLPTAKQLAAWKAEPVHWRMIEAARTMVAERLRK